jgi:hypothetical protein
MKLTKHQKVYIYMCGFQDGVAHRTLLKLKYPPAYLQGYSAGQKAWQAAVSQIREELKCPLTSAIND